VFKDVGAWVVEAALASKVAKRLTWETSDKYGGCLEVCPGDGISDVVDGCKVGFEVSAIEGEQGSVCVEVVVEVNDVGVEVKRCVSGNVEEVSCELGSANAAACVSEGYW
jgi:hypothetical protein